ncbi:MAG: hypothetical protein A2Y64_04790 [Candidatus Coatesbacteria bacterium RBG_13_66_14]|uniref:Uncharacterized protein n=1 Tax=Candidatus Coatesbacteria bacterium RBG_13_66_14 TaxID=1817816 RepID=A0A1F5FG31_9BACT|nr:MAG: hypothetical protein A2Y64_04790 [Candidatus Coatesbacteria bacterium RBG_13_66_14]
MMALKGRTVWIITASAVAALAALVWILGYTEVGSDPAYIYVAQRSLGGAETLMPGSTTWLFPLVDSLVPVPAGLHELSCFAPVKTSDGGLEVEVRLELDLDPAGAEQVVDEWGADWSGGLIRELLDSAVGERAFDGTNAELYTVRRGELLTVIEPGIRDWLTERAPDLRVGRIALPSARFTAAPQDEADFFQPVKVILLGMDALDDDLLNDLIDMGELPNFARMRDEGYLGTLQSEAPYFSPMIWTTFATGKPADEHGITAFTRTNPETGRLEPLSAMDRKVSAFWEFLGGRGLSSIVVNWYYSWPTGEIKGFNLTNYAWEPKFGKGFSGIPHYDELPGKDWPEGITEKVNEAIADRPYISEDDYALAGVLPDIPAATADGTALEGGPPLPHYLERDVLAANACFWLMDHEDWNIAAVYEEFPDVLCHLIWPAHAYRWEELTGEPANLPPIPPFRRELAEEAGDTIIEAYRFEDKLLGLAMDRWGDEAVIVVVSDHGFDTIYPPRTILIGDDQLQTMMYWHDPTGVFGLWGRHVRQGVSGEITIYDFLPTVLALLGVPAAQDMPGRVVEEAIEPEFLERMKAGPLAERPETYDPGEREVDRDIVNIMGEAELERLRALGYLQ